MKVKFYNKQKELKGEARVPSLSWASMVSTVIECAQETNDTADLWFLCEAEYHELCPGPRRVRSYQHCGIVTDRGWRARSVNQSVPDEHILGYFVVYL